MAYNSYFQQGYNSFYQPMQQAQGNQGILWVQGIEAAKAYPVAPGGTVLLMDSDSSRLYIKTADQSGMPNLRVFEYSEITGGSPVQAKQEQIDTSMFVTHEELERALAGIAPKKKEAKRNE